MVFIHRNPAHTSHLRKQQAMVDALNYGELERARPGLKIMVEHSNELGIPCTHLQSFDEINWDEYTEHSFRSKSLVHLIRTACTLSHACTPSRAKRASGQAHAPSADPVVDTLCRVEKQCPLLWWSDRPVMTTGMCVHPPYGALGDTVDTLLAAREGLLPSSGSRQGHRVVAVVFTFRQGTRVRAKRQQADGVPPTIAAGVSCLVGRDGQSYTACIRAASKTTP